MTSIILFGGWVFWSVLSILFLFLVYFIEDKKDVYPWKVLFILIGVGIVFSIGYKSTVVSWWNAITFQSIIINISIYLSIGVLWSFFRWWVFVGVCVKEYVKEAKMFHGSGTTIRKETFIPNSSYNKERIGTWIVFWPLSVLRYLVGDLFGDIISKVVTFFSSIYDRITESRFN